MSPFEEVAPYKEKRKKRKQEKESCAGSQLSRHENKWRPGKEKIRKKEKGKKDKKRIMCRLRVQLLCKELESQKRTAREE